MKKWNGIFVAAAAALAMFVVAPARAQDTASIQGKVLNPAGQPLDHGDVKLTKEPQTNLKDMKFTSSFPIGKDGTYKGTGIAAGDYYAFVVVGDKSPDNAHVSLKAGDNKTVDFDMSRPEYIAKMTPEEKKALEEYKAKNAAATQANKQIANLNATLLAVRADLAKNGAPVYGDVSKDVSDMKTAVDAKPDESVLWINYARALETQGDHLAYADRQAHKVVTDDTDAMSTYGQAVDAYKKGIDLNAAAKKPNPADQAASWNGIGNTLAKEGKTKDAADAFENAVKLVPQDAGMYYNNEAAVLFNANQMDAAAAAADKAIAADPNRPDPYFVKAQALVQHATVDPKTQLPVAPPGCIEAYQKYLQLAPDGPHADSVREVLTGFGQKIDTHYKAGKH
jgi:tetratricopeptide (TPR) repeat protein